MLRGAFPDADLYVFPGLYLTGEHPFVHPPRDTTRTHGPNRDPSHAPSGVSRSAPGGIVAGSIVERDDDALYDAAVVFPPSRRLAARYRKVFTWRPFERYASAPSSPVFSIRTRQGRRDDLLRRLVPGDGAEPRAPRGEVIARPTLTTTPDREEELVLARANAMTNSVTSSIRTRS